MPIPSLLMDLCALGLIIGCAAFYAHRGFVAGLFSFFSTLGALLIAVLGARYLAPIIFDSFFAPGIVEGVTTAIESQGITDVNTLVNDALGFLPPAMREAVLQNIPQVATFSAADMAWQVVDNVVQPIVVPFIQIILFFILLSLARLIIAVVRRLANGVSRLPVVSTVNKAAGAVIGVLVSLLYIYILLCFIWGYDVLNPVNAMGETYFAKSFVWELLRPFNFFAQI